MKPCPRGGAFDFENSQILTSSRLGGGGTNIDRCIIYAFACGNVIHPCCERSYTDQQLGLGLELGWLGTKE